MKIIKILSNMNIIVLGAYIPYLIINFDDFFFGKTKQAGILGLSLFMFIATFVCAGIILVISNNKNIESSVDISEIKNISKPTLIFLFIIYIVGLVIMLLRIHDEAIIFYIAVSSLTFVVIIVEQILIPKIDISPYYKISLPWYLYPIPFIVFIGGNMISTNVIPDEKQGAAAIILLISAGIMMAFLAWHSSFIVNEESKTIEKDGGILALFKPVTITMSYENIRCIKKKGIYYIVANGSEELKINRLYSGIKRFEKTLKANGIIIE